MFASSRPRQYARCACPTRALRGSSFCCTSGSVQHPPEYSAIVTSSTASGQELAGWGRGFQQLYARSYTCLCHMGPRCFSRCSLLLLVRDTIYTTISAGYGRGQTIESMVVSATLTAQVVVHWPMPYARSNLVLHKCIMECLFIYVHSRGSTAGRFNLKIMFMRLAISSVVAPALVRHFCLFHLQRPSTPPPSRSPCIARCQPLVVSPLQPIELL